MIALAERVPILGRSQRRYLQLRHLRPVGPARSETRTAVPRRAASSGSTQRRLPSRFAVRSDPAAGTFWTAQAGATVDLSIFKNVQLREGLRLQLRGEFFNLFNRVNFGFTGSTVGTPGYGVIQSAGDARMVQIGLKLPF
jgi:hypothetical protein